MKEHIGKWNITIIRLHCETMASTYPALDFKQLSYRITEYNMNSGDNSYTSKKWEIQQPLATDLHTI